MLFRLFDDLGVEELAFAVLDLEWTPGQEDEAPRLKRLHHALTHCGRKRTAVAIHFQNIGHSRLPCYISGGWLTAT